jgi:4-hydroxybenzoate polyprenyltransferase
VESEGGGDGGGNGGGNDRGEEKDEGEMRAGIRDFLVVSRANIQVASLPTALVGAVLAAGKLSELWDVGLLLYVLLFFLILTFACNLNCLSDEDVDAKFKKNMSDSVRSIGPSRMKAILSVEVLLAVGLIAGLVMLKNSAVYLLAIGALGLAYLYSAPPLRIKKRGWLSPLPVMFGLYALPPVAGWYLVRGRLGGPILILALGYAMLMEGITIVNTCEDYPEDRSAGIRTLAHALGIRRTLVVGAWLAGLGGVMALAVLFFVAAAVGLPRPPVLFGIGIFSGYYIWVVGSVIRVLRGAALAMDPAAECKIHAKRMPGWFLKTRYSLLFIALLLK